VKAVTSNRNPSIFRATKPDPPDYPFSEKIIDDWSGDEICPNCNKSLAEHNVREGVRCALNVLRGEKE